MIKKNTGNLYFDADLDGNGGDPYGGGKQADLS